MPLYYTDLVDDSDGLVDWEGVDQPADRMVSATLNQALDCMGGDVREGRFDLGYRLEVRDEASDLVHCLSFLDAIQIQRHPAMPNDGEVPLINA